MPIQNVASRPGDRKVDAHPIGGGKNCSRHDPAGIHCRPDRERHRRRCRYRGDRWCPFRAYSAALRAPGCHRSGPEESLAANISTLVCDSTGVVSGSSSGPVMRWSIPPPASTGSSKTSTISVFTGTSTLPSAGLALTRIGAVVSGHIGIVLSRKDGIGGERFGREWLL